MMVEMVREGAVEMDVYVEGADAAPRIHAEVVSARLGTA
jgi:hypothetical protein